MNVHRVAILGAGNGGCAAAADLTLKGYQTRLYSRSPVTLEPLRRRGGITLIEQQERRFATPHLITTDLGEAVGGADLIMITTPSPAHDFLARAVAPHLNDGQLIHLNPGHTGGSLHFSQVLRETAPGLFVRFCETVTLTYICRMTGPAEVEVYRRTSHLLCAGFPSKQSAESIAVLKSIYPVLISARNVMETGLSNINAIMHPAGMVANAGWIEKTRGNFLFYREAISPAVARVIEAVDRERLEIVQRLGLPLVSFIEIFYRSGLTSETALRSASVYRATQDSEPNSKIKSPPRLDHRYLNEDVAYGLVPMAEFARLVGVDTPTIDALITLASQMNRVDYRREGLTLEKMGLSGINAGELPKLLQEGFSP